MNFETVQKNVLAYVPSLCAVAAIAYMAFGGVHCRTYGVRENPFAESEWLGLAAWGQCGILETAGNKDGNAVHGTNPLHCKMLEAEARRDIQIARCVWARDPSSAEERRKARAACLKEVKPIPAAE